ncbi:hypothetical protein [Pontibacter beigongshangensis]|uniref:hypothetical protein n=1 Tax=Pontibacter beigongshangensis TaxID=2574733 RepID=UPI00164FD8C6|nr:hypothetical protein [Pontibacter beigongshangensis]
MSHLLESQQIEISAPEAKDLARAIWLVVSRPVDARNKLELFEAIAFPCLRQAGLKLARRAMRAKSGKKIKLTLTAQELLSIHQLINEFPVELYNILSTIDRKVRNYDQKVEI